MNEVRIFETMYILVFDENQEISDIANYLVFEFIQKNIGDLCLFFTDKEFIQKTFLFLKMKNKVIQIIFHK